MAADYDPIVWRPFATTGFQAEVRFHEDSLLRLLVSPVWQEDRGWLASSTLVYPVENVEDDNPEVTDTIPVTLAGPSPELSDANHAVQELCWRTALALRALADRLEGSPHRLQVLCGEDLTLPPAREAP